jgi:hypothetical protein
LEPKQVVVAWGEVALWQLADYGSRFIGVGCWCYQRNEREPIDADAWIQAGVDVRGEEEELVRSVDEWVSRSIPEDVSDILRPSVANVGDALGDAVPELRDVGFYIVGEGFASWTVERAVCPEMLSH